MTEAQLTAVTMAAERWRDALDAEVIRLRVAPLAAAACGRVDLTFAPMRGLTNGTTIRRGCRASIVLQTDLPSRYMSVVAAHELGHALGLDHAAARDSLMYVNAPFDGGTISASQRDYVRALLE